MRPSGLSIRRPRTALRPCPSRTRGCCRRGRRCFRRLIGNCRVLCQDRHGHVMWASQEAPFRSTGDRKDTTMIKQAVSCSAAPGLDVGKSSHWACLVANRGEDLDALFSRAVEGTLFVVDQVRNIGPLVIGRARLAGLEVSYLPGIAAHGASKLFAGDAKTDERDAMAIAKTALGIPDALPPAPAADERLGAARSMAAQRSHMVACATRDKNRLCSVLLESCPASGPARRPSSSSPSTSRTSPTTTIRHRAAGLPRGTGGRGRPYRRCARPGRATRG